MSAGKVIMIPHGTRSAILAKETFETGAEVIQGILWIERDSHKFPYPESCRRRGRDPSCSPCRSLRLGGGLKLSFLWTSPAEMGGGACCQGGLSQSAHRMVQDPTCHGRPTNEGRGEDEGSDEHRREVRLLAEQFRRGSVKKTTSLGIND